MKKKFSFSTLNYTFLIAEAGTSHGGDRKKAEELVLAAAEAGADCIKFQIVYADEIIHPKTGMVPLPGGDIPLYERFRSFEQPPEFYTALKGVAENAGIRFLCTPFGIRSARILKNIGADMLKIASPELNHIPLLQEISTYGLPIILSTGVSLLGDIDEAIRLLHSGAAAVPSTDSGHPDSLRKTPETALLHCITAYPAPEEEYNLRLIPNLASIFGVPTGVSDHSTDPILVPALSAALGAKFIEKHFCLDPSGDGLDDPIALSPHNFGKMVRVVRRVEKLLKERNSTAFDELQQEYGEQRVQSVLGDGRKRLSPAERDNYGRSNRSIHAVSDLPAGTFLTAENIAVLRTEKELLPGIHPRYYTLLLRKQIRRTVEAGQGICWKDILS